MTVVVNPAVSGYGGGGGNSVANGNGDTAPLAVQTVTPNVSNAVPIVIDRNLGVNVLLGSPIDNIQVVNVPLNMSSGQSMEIDLMGGGGNGAWTAWSAGSPNTPGYFWVQGTAVTADPSAANKTKIFVTLWGSAKYECTIGAVVTA